MALCKRKENFKMFSRAHAHGINFYVMSFYLFLI